MGVVRTPRWRPLAAVVATALAAASCGGGAGAATLGRPIPGLRLRRRARRLPLVEVIYDCLTVEQRLGQLFMVGLSSSDPGAATLAPAIGDHHLGGVVLDGSGWSSAPGWGG